MIDSSSPLPTACAVFTVGFAALPIERFLGNLRFHDIDLLLDVRSAPYSRQSPQFDLHNLEAASRRAGLEYLYLGNRLGGRPPDPAFYDAAGHVCYDRVAAQPWFRQGIREVMGLAEQGRRLALACGEDDPRRCHRRLLVGRVLREQGLGLAHILGDGSLVAEAELLDEERTAPSGALSDAPSGAPGEWKSARPVRGVDPGGTPGR